MRAAARCGLAARVLDRLRLVEDEQRRSGASPAALSIAREQRVGRDHDVAAAEPAPTASAGRRRARSRTRRCGANRASSRCQLPTRLVGATISAGAIEAPGLLLGDEVRDRLQRLAEPHVVGEHAARAVRAQVLQPAQALLLVRAQRGAQTAGHGGPRRGAPASARPRSESAVAPVHASRWRAPDTARFGEGGVELAQRAGARGREAHRPPPSPWYSSPSTFIRMRSRSGGTVTYWLLADRQRERATARHRQTLERAPTPASTAAGRAAPATGSRGGRRPRCRARG